MEATCANGMRRVELQRSLKMCLKDTSEPSLVSRLTASVRDYHGGPFRISGTPRILMSFKINEDKVREKEAVALVLGDLSMSENNAIVAEVMDSEKVEAGSWTSTQIPGVESCELPSNKFV